MSGPTPTDPMQVRIEGPSPALSVAFDLAKRSLWLAPVIVFGSAAIWGIEGVYSTLYALADRGGELPARRRTCSPSPVASTPR